MSVRREMVVGGLCLLGAAVVSAQATECQLGPPTDQDVQLTNTTTTTMVLESRPEEPVYSLVEDREFLVHVTMEGDQRWLLAEPVRSSVQRNGQAVEDPVTPILHELEDVSFASDAHGHLVGLRGHFRGRDLAGVDPASPAEGSRPPGSANEPLATDELYPMWRDLHGGHMWATLAGRELNVGDSWSNETFVSVPAGPPGLLDGVAVTKWWRFLGAAGGAAGPGPQHHVQFQYEVPAQTIRLADPAASRAAQWIGTLAPELQGRQWSSVTVEKDGDVVLDPDAMMADTESTDRIRLTFTSDGPPQEQLHVSMEAVRRWVPAGETRQP